MKLIVVRSSSDEHQTYYHLRGRRLIGSGLISVVVLVTLGFFSGMHFRNLNSSGVLTSQELQEWRSTLVQQRQDVDDIRETSVVELDALAILVDASKGSLRLNALGERLVTMAELSPDEFNFSELPAIGGPEELLESTQVFQTPSFTDQIDDWQKKLTSKPGNWKFETLLLDRNLQKMFTWPDDQ